MPRNEPWPSRPYSGEFHLTALRAPGTVRTMSVSRRRPTSRFQPGMAAMVACTEASPVPGCSAVQHGAPGDHEILVWPIALRGALLIRDRPKLRALGGPV